VKAHGFSYPLKWYSSYLPISTA